MRPDPLRRRRTAVGGQGKGRWYNKANAADVERLGLGIVTLNSFFNSPNFVWLSITLANYLVPVTLNSFFNSPNFVWLSITLANYLVPSYDFDRSRGRKTQKARRSAAQVS
jgi:hypothetical protein